MGVFLDICGPYGYSSSAQSEWLTVALGDSCDVLVLHQVLLEFWLNINCCLLKDVLA